MIGKQAGNYQLVEKLGAGGIMAFYECPRHLTLTQAEAVAKAVQMTTPAAKKAATSPAFVEINSTPPNAKIEIDDKPVGTTPWRGQPKPVRSTLVLTRSGCSPERMPVNFATTRKVSLVLKCTRKDTIEPFDPFK